MQKKECVAMILAGGKGSRLGSLTKKLAKPAVPFGGKYRIIDFSLSNCRNSDLDTVGVLTQYQPLALHRYIGNGSVWNLDREYGGVYILPPYMREKGADWYKGTADAIYQNINFINLFDPSYVLVLSGDHIYTMNYRQMLAFHKAQAAEVTIAVREVPRIDAFRFGILKVAENGRITDFTEKPAQPRSNLASMGIYIFNWKLLRRVLEADNRDGKSGHDFGKNIIPGLLAAGVSLAAYPFTGYWKDVGTIESYWEANMDLLTDEPELDLYNDNWPIYTANPNRPPQYIGRPARVSRSLIGEGCRIYGQVEHSVVFPGAYVAEGALVSDSIIMPYVNIGPAAQIDRAIIGRRTVVEGQVEIGSPAADSLDPGLTVIVDHTVLPYGFKAKEENKGQKQVV